MTGTAFVAIVLYEGFIFEQITSKKATIVSVSLLLQFGFHFIASLPKKATILIIIITRKKLPQPLLL